MAAASGGTAPRHAANSDLQQSGALAHVPEVLLGRAAMGSGGGVNRLCACVFARFGLGPSATFFLGTKLSVIASQGSRMCMLLGLCPPGESVIQYEHLACVPVGHTQMEECRLQMTRTCIHFLKDRALTSSTHVSQVRHRFHSPSKPTTPRMVGPTEMQASSLKGYPRIYCWHAMCQSWGAGVGNQQATSSLSSQQTQNHDAALVAICCKSTSLDIWPATCDYGVWDTRAPKQCRAHLCSLHMEAVPNLRYCPLHGTGPHATKHMHQGGLASAIYIGVCSFILSLIRHSRCQRGSGGCGAIAEHDVVQAERRAAAAGVLKANLHAPREAGSVTAVGPTRQGFWHSHRLAKLPVHQVTNCSKPCLNQKSVRRIKCKAARHFVRSAHNMCICHQTTQSGEAEAERRLGTCPGWSATLVGSG